MNINRLKIGSIVQAGAAGAVMLVLGACATTGVGSGTTRSGAEAYAFSWSSGDGISGTLTATEAATGHVYTGRFFQVTSETHIDDLHPLWAGWGRRVRGWDYWGPDGGSAFVTHYSGRVLANLEDAGGMHMRCNFRLVKPVSGLAGGGEGRCQIPGGSTISATFARK